MIIFAFIFGALLFIPWKVESKGFNESYLSRDTANAIKGAFCFFMLAAHFTQNDFYPIWKTDYWFLSFKKFYDQLVVSVLFFYSAYGIMESIRAKGLGYVKRIPVSRFLKTYIPYVIALLIFIAANTLFGIRYSRADIVLSLTAWRTIGIDNWYIFTIFVFYFMTWAVFLLCRKNHFLANCLLTAGTVLFIAALKYAGRDSYWYDILMVYPMGFWYSHYREKIERWLFCNRHYYPVFAAVLSLLFIIWVGICRMNGEYSVILYELCACLWMAGVLLFTMKVRPENRILKFIGKNLTGYYMLHRLALLITPTTKFFIILTPVRFLLFFAISTVFAVVFTYISGKITGAVIRKIHA